MVVIQGEPLTSQALRLLQSWKLRSKTTHCQRES